MCELEAVYANVSVESKRPNLFRSVSSLVAAMLVVQFAILQLSGLEAVVLPLFTAALRVSCTRSCCRWALSYCMCTNECLFVGQAAQKETALRRPAQSG